MFGQITEKFQLIIKNVRGLGKITDKNIHDTVREVRKTLIDADVNFKVVKSFVSTVEKKAQGTKVLKSIKPGEQFVKIIKDELVELLGSEPKKLVLNQKPSVVMLSGLQGAGKTTTAGKLACLLKNEGKSVLLVAADIYRPAAVEQLKILGRKIDVEVFEKENLTPELLSKKAVEKAKLMGQDTVIIDTAGRLHIDKEMMGEAKKIVKYTDPEEILFIADGMSGQDAISSILAFHETLSITGVILTKMDGDSRGGAALSISHITGVPIKFVGNSESIEGLEIFDPKRIADRILGFGDIISLVEKAQNIFDEENKNRIEEKIKLNNFDLEDFNVQLKQIKKMGPIGKLMELMPGMNSKILKKMNMDDKHLKWSEAIISSMTIHERKTPNIINGSRRLRIAKGSGRSVQEVNALINNFLQMKKMMKKMKNFKQINIPGFGNLQ